LKLYLAWLSKGSNFFSDQVDEAISLAQRIYSLIKTDEKLNDLLEITSRHTSKDELYAQICFRPRLNRLKLPSVEDKSKATRYVHHVLQQQQQQQYAVDFAPVDGNQGDFFGELEISEAAICT
jgi:hypothetical protein